MVLVQLMPVNKVVPACKGVITSLRKKSTVTELPILLPPEFITHDIIAAGCCTTNR